MNTRLLIALFLLCVVNAAADPLVRRPPPPTDGPAELIPHTVKHRPLGIEGNGQPILGIEGNGVIQRVGSDGVVVNDSLYAYGAPTVQVRMDGQATDIASVLPGHVARVGAREPGQGTNVDLAIVDVDNLIRGPIDAGGVDVTAATLSVLGQTVPVADFTEVGGALGELTLGELADGDYLTIGGFVDPSGAVLTTRVQRVAASAVLEVSGRVVALDALQLTMGIGELTIDYSSAQFVGLAANDLALDDRLEVVGDVLTGGGVLIAGRIRRIAPMPGAEVGRSAESQGFVTSDVVSGRFDLSGTTVQVSAATEYERGVAADVSPGRFVEVEGTYDAAGVLLAARVEFDEEPLESEIRVASLVTGVNLQAATIELLGLDATISVATRLEDHTGSGSSFADINDIAPGQFVEVRAYDAPDGSNQLAATRVTREMPDESLLRGRVGSTTGSAITVLGRAIRTTPETRYSDASDTDISASEFFAAALPGVLVKARGTATANGIVALRLDLE